ncbi:MAG: OmpA family protein [Flammeovirgaceae bacterium]
MNLVLLNLLNQRLNCFWVLMIVFYATGIIELAAQQRVQLVNNPELTPDIIEKDPVVSWNGKVMVFISNKGGKWKFYEAKRSEAGVWGEVKSLDQLNAYSEAGGSIHSPTLNYNGTIMYFGANYENDGGGMNLYYSEKKGGVWKEPIKLDKPINTENYEGSPSISPDGKTLYFVRNNPLGEYKDYICRAIYVSYKNNRGRWSEPELLPSPINLGCEENPQVSFDGKTLYFSSIRKYKDEVGREAKDGYDLYYTKKLGNRIWLSPIILDSLSTDDDDQSPTLAAFGDSLYYSSHDQKKKNLKKHYGSVYTGKLPSHARPAYVMRLQGVILDQNSKQPVAAQLHLKDPYTSETIAIYENEPTTGAYEIFLPAGRAYQIDASNAGYSHDIFQYDLRKLDKNKSIERNIEIYAKVRLTLNVFDQELFELLTAKITIFDQEQRTEIEEAAATLVSKGRYELTLPIGKHYLFRLEAQHYQTLEYLFDMRQVVRFAKYEEDLTLKREKHQFQVKVMDQETQLGLKEAIQVTNVARREHITIRETDVVGTYRMELRAGDTYQFKSHPAGYAFFDSTLTINAGTQESLLIALTPIKEETKFVLNNISFELNSADLVEESYLELDRVVEFIKENQQVSIELSAHTDDRGTDEYNLFLSDKRAEAVKRYFIEKGVLPERLTSKGYGESQPLVENTSEENRAKNRRVELKIIKVDVEE